MTLQKSLGQHTQSLADYMPGGPLFAARNIQESNFRQLLRGLAGELFTAQGYLITLEKEYFPNATNLFLSEWEKALGIPDDCFSGTGDNNERRRDILVKLSALGVQTAGDFVALGALFGKVITVTPLSDEVFPPHPVPHVPTALPEARFIMKITGENIVSGTPPHAVPHLIVTGESVLECLFNKVAQSNGRLIFVNSN